MHIRVVPAALYAPIRSGDQARDYPREKYSARLPILPFSEFSRETSHPAEVGYNWLFNRNFTTRFTLTG